MSQVFNFLFFISILILASAEITNVEDLHIDVRDQIMDGYLESGNMKQLFKAYHFAYGKSYDYNTIQGLDKYKTFKANIKELIEHNKSDATWKMGINHLTDMTFEEVSNYYNLKYFTPSEVSRNLRTLSLDDFDDSEEDNSKQIKAYSKDINWTLKNVLQPVKNQKSCGSCWAFATISMIEGTYGVLKGKLAYQLSTQHLVDCDTLNSGCNGGWYTNAINFLKNGTYKESDYPYKAVKCTCQASTKTKTCVKPLSHLYTTNADANYQSLTLGPIATAIDANSNFMKYKTGIFSSTCAKSVNHAVLLVGYNVAEDYWILQNSWGNTWGDKGFIKLKNDPLNNNSCNIGKYGFRATY